MTPIRKVYTESIVCSGRVHRIFMLRAGLLPFQARGQCLLNTLIMLLHKLELENSILVRWELAPLRFEYPRIVIASLPSETLARITLFFSSCILTPQIDKPPPAPPPLLCQVLIRKRVSIESSRLFILNKMDLGACGKKKEEEEAAWVVRFTFLSSTALESEKKNKKRCPLLTGDGLSYSP